MKLHSLLRDIILIFLMHNFLSVGFAQQPKSPKKSDFEKIQQQMLDLQRQMLENMGRDFSFKNFDQWENDDDGKQFFFKMDTAFSWSSDGIFPFGKLDIDSIFRSPDLFFKRFFDLSQSFEGWNATPPADENAEEEDLLPEERLRLQENAPQPTPPAEKPKKSADHRKKTVRI